MKKKYGLFATVHMIYWFVDVCSSRNTEVWVDILFRLGIHPMDWYGGASLVLQTTYVFIIDYFWLIYYSNDSMRWLRSMHIHHNIMSWVQGNRIDMTHCVHNSQSSKHCQKIGSLVSLQSTHFGKLKADDRGWWYIWYVFICMTKVCV